MKTLLTSLLLLLITQTGITQNIAYVTAESGLIVRSEPKKNGHRLGKYTYRDSVSIARKTGISIAIIDNGLTLEGEWYLVDSYGTNWVSPGYVFSCYLSDEIPIPLEYMTIIWKDLTIQMEKIAFLDQKSSPIQAKTASVKLEIDLGDTPQNKLFTITNTSLNNINIYQRYKNNITIMNEGPHCDLTDWNSYLSPWQQITQNKEGHYTILSYTKEDRQKMETLVDMDALRKQVKNTCGDGWEKLIKNTKKPNEYPCAITQSAIYLKITGTTTTGTIVEKIIEFEIPMGC